MYKYRVCLLIDIFYNVYCKETESGSNKSMISTTKQTVEHLPMFFKISLKGATAAYYIHNFMKNPRSRILLMEIN